MPVAGPDLPDSRAEPSQPLGPRLLGWALLLLGLPFALLGALAPPNEYQAVFGKNWLDCDGPFGVYIMAGPPLLLYGTAFVVNAVKRRKRTNLIVAILCFAICAALIVNIGRAVAEEAEQAEGCAAR